MAAPLSISSNPLTSRHCYHLHFPSTSFKGNVSVLGANPSQILSLKLNQKVNQTRKQFARPLLVVVSQTAATSSEGAVAPERFRLNNLGPQPGSRKRQKRKGRGISAGQGASCGFGMRGQKSRSGPGIMRGFEGGQTALYRRLPKLRGIAGGMRSGLPKYLPVNIKDIETAGFQEGDEVSLESLKQKGLINPSGRERKLPLKILGTGELSMKLNFKARAFSTQAKEKLEASGCTLTVLPGRKKWVKPSVAKNQARADEYFAKKRAAAAEATTSEPAASA
ncbi:PREDICTED: 50S ribosomal protein L15, chloroplastic [Camelina sativa]|uniref:50S ribosomal protein L15, chloroplastic n=1 Tax=Camelina sativa TaxID=90675 RepID=A0ABM0TEN4_CAMSA|nr:PREDICTED: 50S ribosomal protein L15, chloroplastic [Camelina sativa]